MRSILWLAAVAGCFLSCGNETPSRTADAPSEIYTATAYSIDGETASGADTRRGIVAADPDVLPIGTRIRVSEAGRYSGVYVVSDTGRKIKGKEIDLFMPSAAEAKEFGKQQVRVEVLDRREPQKDAGSQ